MYRLYDVAPAREALRKLGPSDFLHGDDGDLGQQYRRELTPIRSVRAFEGFVRRWHGFYRLGVQENNNYMERALLKRFNTQRVFDKWMRCDAGKSEPYDGEGYYYALAATVALPTVLLTTFQVSRRYGAPFNTCLVQIYNQGGGEFF